MITYMIRHGKTLANEKSLYSGFTDLSLTVKGKLQLLKLKNEINYPKGDIYITSGLKRTNETLEILYGRKPDIEMEEFKEINFGDFEMRSHLELLEDQNYKAWIEDFPNKPCPNGECMSDVVKRIKIGIKKLENLKINNIILISHGGIIGSIIKEYSEERLYKQMPLFQLSPDNGRGYTALFDNEKIIDFSNI